MSEVEGLCADRFAPVRDAFAESFARGEELGAGFALAVDGELVVDLAGGLAEKAHGDAPARVFGRDTLVPVFSTTKALAALMIARLVDRGALSYGQAVAEVWPEFGQAGKAQVTVEQALSHQAGVAGLSEPMAPSDWYDWDEVCRRIAAQTPLWPPGTASGYHAATYGYIAGEIFRRVDGRTIGVALRQDVAGPLGLDLWIGLPASEDGRVADMELPRSLPDFGSMNEPRRLAFMVKWAAPGPRTAPQWRRAEIPSSNGHATASALARLMSALAGDGRLDGTLVLSPDIVTEAARERIRGPDLVMPYTMAWGAGLIRNDPLGVYGPGKSSFGHSGWGGSCAFADPERRMAGAYVMNRQSALLLGDPRPRRLIEAAYACL
jgi:CubicO group peptidase (beta-lactamase class C family)